MYKTRAIISKGKRKTKVLKNSILSLGQFIKNKAGKRNIAGAHYIL